MDAEELDTATAQLAIPPSNVLNIRIRPEEIISPLPCEKRASAKTPTLEHLISRSRIGCRFSADPPGPSNGISWRFIAEDWTTGFNLHIAAGGILDLFIRQWAGAFALAKHKGFHDLDLQFDDGCIVTTDVRMLGCVFATN